MGLPLCNVILAKHFLRHQVKAASRGTSGSMGIPRGFCAVYVGEVKKKRFVVPVSYLNKPLFQDLLSKAEEEYGFDHPMGGLTIPCEEETFLDITSRLSSF